MRRKVRRLVANNKKGRFVGTDFSYGDIIGHKVDHWAHTLTGTETLDGQTVHVISSTPRTEAVRVTSGYARRKLWIRADNFVAIRAH